MMDRQIVVEGLNFSYGNQVVLQDIYFSVGRNETVTIAGPNGGGKTTLLRLLAGLLLPHSGSILIDHTPAAQVRRQVGYVPQYTHFDPRYPISVFEVVLSGLLKPLGFYSPQDKTKAKQIIEQMELDAWQHKPFSHLSGGQKQRMLLGRALIANLPILLLDEPTSNIDEESKKKLAQFLRGINSHATIILVTHDKDFLSEISTQTFYVNRTLRNIVAPPTKERKKFSSRPSSGRRVSLIKH